LKTKKGLLFIAVAVLFGLLAFIGVFNITSKMAPSVPVLKANTNISSGTPLDRSMFTEIKIPESGMPEGLLSPSIDFSATVAAKDISEGDLLRKPAILSLDDPNPSLYSARLKNLGNPCLRGIEVPVESIRGVLSGMNTQDYVDLISVYEKKCDDCLDGLDGPDGKDIVIETSETIIKFAPVIGVQDEDKQNMVLVIAVTEDEAEIIALHQEIGKIYATLRPFGGGN